jgi:hypothetical protein
VTEIGRTFRVALCCAALAASTAACVVHETRPLQKINATQADHEIPADELLDVAVRAFDPGIPPAIAKDEQALNKKRIYPDIRRAESRYVATMLRGTLEASGQWGAVRVVPETVQFVDVQVSGKITESTGAKLALQVTVTDSTGRVWINNKRYESSADTGSYKTDAALKARDPFQNVYSEVANDMLAARETIVIQSRRDIHRVTQLEFARDLAPQAMDGYLDHDQRGLVKLARLPAADDPISTRIDRIRERDSGVVDTVNGYYANFADQMSDSYGQWRRASFEEIEKEERTLNKARTRTYLGAAAVLASVFVPQQCGLYDYNCRRVEGAVRTAGAIGGAASILSGLKKYSDAKTHAQALKELSESFQNEVAPQVVDVEGRMLKLTGTAEEQYSEWRKLLHEMYLENGTAGAPAPMDTPPVGAPLPRVQPVALPAGDVTAAAAPVEPAH